MSQAIFTAETIFENSTKKTQDEIDQATTVLENAVENFNSKVIQSGNATALYEKIYNVITTFNEVSVGTGVGQVSQADKEALSVAITAAQDVYNDRAQKTQEELDGATAAIENALVIFNNKVIVAGDASALTTAIADAKNLLETAVEGIAVGQYVVGSKDILRAAVDAAQLILDDAANKTDQQLADAKDVLEQAMLSFENSKVLELNSLQDVTITAAANDSSNIVTLESGESLVLISSNDAVVSATETPTGTINVTGVAVGGPILVTVQVEKDGVVIKTGVFTVNVVPMSLTSKEITNLDFSTGIATQAKLVSKPVTVDDFTGNRKEFTIVIGEDRIPVYVDWALSKDFPKGAAMGSVVESHIQQYYVDKGGADALMNRPLYAYGTTDTFQISAFQTGAASSFTIEGRDWSYFFDQQIAQGTDRDTTKNRTFTVGDGTNIATIRLTLNFATMDALVNQINNALTNANVEAKAEKISQTQFTITSTSVTGRIIVDGENKVDFFE